MHQPISGNIQLTSLKIAGQSGEIVGLGLIFSTPKAVQQMIQILHAFNGTPQTGRQMLDISFQQGVQTCSFSLTLDLTDEVVKIEVDQITLSILRDLQAALEAQPYYFLIFCRALPSGAVEPYRPSDYHVIKDRFTLNEHEIIGNPNGHWPGDSELFSSL